jgi:transcriptional regulator with XRE-family HTH domain
VELTKSIKLNLAEKLKDKRYRTAFFRARAQDDTAANIRELRERREFSQAELAKRAGMKQSAISRIEQAEYSAWTYKTLQRVADALDARLVVFFEPAEDVIAKYEHKENVSFVSTGTSVDKSAAQKGLQASIYACFASIPRTAKLLALLLANAISEFEKFEGPIQLGKEKEEEIAKITMKKKDV